MNIAGNFNANLVPASLLTRERSLQCRAVVYKFQLLLVAPKGVLQTNSVTALPWLCRNLLHLERSFQLLVRFQKLRRNSLVDKKQVSTATATSTQRENTTVPAAWLRMNQAQTISHGRLVLFTLVQDYNGAWCGLVGNM